VEREVLPTCRELGIGLVAYSPLGRGFLTGRFQNDVTLDEGDFRANLPRFQPENIACNHALVDAVTTIAARKSCTPAQIALAWLLAQGDNIVPIPGTRRIQHLHDNLGALKVPLEDDDLAELNRILNAIPVIGERYTEEGMKGVGT